MMTKTTRTVTIKNLTNKNPKTPKILPQKKKLPNLPTLTKNPPILTNKKKRPRPYPTKTKTQNASGIFF